MQFPTWLKPALLGATAGAVALALFGFSGGGWMTSGAAAKMAENEARDQLVAAMTPVCVTQAEKDPQQVVKMAKIQDTVSYKRHNAVMDTGWATMPGSTEADREIARACLEVLEGKL